MTVACNRCEGCLDDRVKDWSTRIALEAQMHELNSFITLTYDDMWLPPGNGLHIRDYQLFMKRLRYWLTEKRKSEDAILAQGGESARLLRRQGLTPTRVRYYAAGEYGPRTLRPHYHAILFGYDFPDKYQFRTSQTGHAIYRSPTLERLWPMGHSEIGSVTRESGKYVAGYVLKKLDGGDPYDYERKCDCGHTWKVPREFAIMSSKPGIGGDWFQKYATDAFPKDFVVLDGSKISVPRYFGRKAAEENISAPDALIERDGMTEIRRQRRKKMNSEQAVQNRTPERLAVRAELAREKRKFFRDKQE